MTDAGKTMEQTRIKPLEVPLERLDGSGVSASNAP